MTRTRTDALLEIIDQAYNEALALSGHDHTPDQMASFLTHVGGQVEVFLKVAVYGGARNKSNFDALINDLQTFGIPTSVTATLHTLRQTYNKAKHDPLYHAPTGDVLKVLLTARGAVQALQSPTIGSTAAPAPEMYRRTLWLAVWDHYIHGDSEVHVFLPSELDFPLRFDTIYIAMESWWEIQQRLAATGQYHEGRHLFPANVHDGWKGESDFLTAGVYEGEYRALLSLLSAHERRLDLLPGLRRENDPTSMYNALLLAAGDVVAGGQLVDDEAELAARIATQAADQYAAPRFAPVSTHLAPMLAHLLLEVDNDLRSAIRGPYWPAPATVASLARTARTQLRDGGVLILVTDDGRLVLGYGTRAP